MGIIRTNEYFTVSRSKVYILKYTDYSKSYSMGSREGIVGYFTSKENADKYIKQLIENRTIVTIKIGKNKDDKDIIRYAKINKFGNSDIINAINYIIEEHEMDLDANEISYCRIMYPNMEPQIEVTVDI